MYPVNVLQIFEVTVGIYVGLMEMFLQTLLEMNDPELRVMALRLSKGR